MDRLGAIIFINLINLFNMDLFTNKYIVFSKSFWRKFVSKTAILLLTAITLICSNVAYSQNARPPLRATGLVTDISTGETLVGATVSVKGRNSSVAVDRTGKFLIDIPNANSVLLVTFVGYTTLEVPLEGKTVLDIKLSKVTTNLEDVVVTGFGLTQKKATLSGAVSQISGEDLAHSKATSASGALIGKVGGVNFRQTTGRPGATPVIRVRNFGGDPLVVIDGTRRNMDAFNALDYNDI